MINILNLNLTSPLFYTSDQGPDPFNCPGDGERLFCFELDETQCLSFTPIKEKLIKSLVFSGIAAGEGDAGPFLELPKGNYTFAQEKRLLSREEIIDMSVEIQQESLWQRQKPGKQLFLRYLFEDGNWVTQLFRPC